ncbi:MAG: tRNA uracil 4-sulfurtransferase ThiI [Erysipelotrichaceae bacterium]|nr:tRNA uracil 4-sulfurtransferase ThiI [Erysipelotrichaceae bacterium]
MNELLYDHIVVRYGELSTKGKNRKDFTKALTNNIKRRLKAYEGLTYKMLHDGLFIKLNGEDYNLIKEDLKQVFGYSYFSGALILPKDIEAIKETALKIALKRDYKTFKVNARRSDKSFPLKSDQINRQVASHILKNSEIKVDVHNPDLMIYIVIDHANAIMMDEKVRGIGGYPTGINGKAMLMMSGGIDSPVAGYMTMKRGLKIEAIHFASEPYTSKQAKEKVLELARQLSVYQGDMLVHVIPFTELQLAIYKHADESYAITIMRRMMYRIADQICKNRKIKLITNGESVGQVASQTPESISVIAKVCETLIMRPLCMMDKIESIDMAKKIGTYETSILPYEDCCTIFDPKNPVTKPKEKECLFFESKFDYQSLIDECIKNDQIIKVSYLDKKEEEEDLF